MDVFVSDGFGLQYDILKGGCVKQSRSAVITGACLNWL
jgi:hypothetical protein